MIVEVYIGSEKVGVLSDESPLAGIAFQYSASWLESGWNISPFALEANTEIQWNAENRVFDGLYGVFADSLPDSWGRMLMDERFRRLGRNPETVSLLERLCFIGDRSWGALVYQPDQAESTQELQNQLNLLEAERSAKAAIEGRMEDVLPTVIESGASTGGARPKQRIAISEDNPDQIWYGKGLPPDGYSAWILKIETDRARQYGRVEKAYYEMAEAAGIRVPETRLLVTTDPDTGEEIAHFAIKRFDWTSKRRLHCHTLAGLLTKHWHQGDTDYDEFFRAVLALTGSQPMVEEAVRRMLFNVWLGVRDDHAKNHAFICRDSGDWELSPAYDVMYAKPGIGNGLHRQMPLLGNRKHIDRALVLQVTNKHQIKATKVDDQIDQTRTAADNWPTISESLKISPARTTEIQATWEPVV